MQGPSRPKGNPGSFDGLHGKANDLFNVEHVGTTFHLSFGVPMAIRSNYASCFQCSLTTDPSFQPAMMFLFDSSYSLFGNSDDEDDDNDDDNNNKDKDENENEIENKKKEIQEQVIMNYEEKLQNVTNLTKIEKFKPTFSLQGVLNSFGIVQGMYTHYFAPRYSMEHTILSSMFPEQFLIRSQVQYDGNSFTSRVKFNSENSTLTFSTLKALHQNLAIGGSIKHNFVKNTQKYSMGWRFITKSKETSQHNGSQTQICGTLSDSGVAKMTFHKSINFPMTRPSFASIVSSSPSPSSSSSSSSMFTPSSLGIAIGYSLNPGKHLKSTLHVGASTVLGGWINVKAGVNTDGEMGISVVPGGAKLSLAYVPEKGICCGIQI